ncbi:MAG: MFS transporter [Isosphaeraceae bacterium]|nr:MFS transporter [Isosphaeraceae bacterium]
MSNGDNDGPPRPSAVRWRVFALACGASFLLYLHRYSWNIVGPKLQEEFQLSHTQSNILFSLFYYTYAGGQVPSGVVIDRFGPHRFLSVSIIAWSAALVALGRTRQLPVLGACRFLFGAAQAGCYPALTKVTRNWFPPSIRTTVQGLVASGAGRSGAALSPILLGTVLLGWCGLSWQSALGVFGLAGAAFGVTFWATFRNTPAEHPGVNAAERKLISSESPSVTPRALGPFPVCRAVRNRSVWFFLAQQFLDAGSDVVFVSLIGAYFLQARGFDIGKTGWLASLPLWGGALGGIAGGWLNDRTIALTGNRRWSRSGVGFVGKLIGCAMLPLVVRSSDGLTAGLVLMTAKFFGDWSQPTTWGSCTDLGGRHSATMFSVINTAGTFGGVVMPPLFGALLDHFTSKAEVAGRLVRTTDWNPLFLLLAAMYLGSGICWLLMDCTRTLDDGDESAPL